MESAQLAISQYPHRRVFYSLLFASLLSAALPASANTLLIWPVNIVFTQGQRTAELWLENRSEDNVALQIRVFEWKQVDGNEDYQPQPMLLASPPFSSIGGGKKQLIRLVRVIPGDDNREYQFRVVIDEIPRKDDKGQSGVQFQMRYSVPIFFQNAALPKEPSIYFEENLTYRTGEGKLSVTNHGAFSARIARLSTVDKTQKKIYLTEGLLGYVLPGSTMEWAFEHKIDVGGLGAEINGEEVRLHPGAK